KQGLASPCSRLSVSNTRPTEITVFSPSRQQAKKPSPRNLFMFPPHSSMSCLHSPIQRPVITGSSSADRAWINSVADSMTATSNQHFVDLISWMVFSAKLVSTLDDLPARVG